MTWIHGQTSATSSTAQCWYQTLASKTNFFSKAYFSFTRLVGGVHFSQDKLILEKQLMHQMSGSVPLEASALNSGGAQLTIFLLTDPHLLEARQWRQKWSLQSRLSTCAHWREGCPGQQWPWSSLYWVLALDLLQHSVSDAHGGWSGLMGTTGSMHIIEEWVSTFGHWNLSLPMAITCLSDSRQLFSKEQEDAAVATSCPKSKAV